MATTSKTQRPAAAELSPQQVRRASFSQTRKGFDPTEVTAFLKEVSEEMARLHNHAVAMERAALAAKDRLLSLTGLTDADEVPNDADPNPVERALFLAHRAAEAVRAEARVEAAKMVAEARGAVEGISSEHAAQLREEIDVLVGRREFLLADLDQLEEFLAAQRRRLQSAGRELLAFAESVPVGLGPESRLHPGQRALEL
jgi:DivIVA domain-containing protein